MSSSYFGVKKDGRHKARLVADGHLTPEPVESIYLIEKLETTVLFRVLHPRNVHNLMGWVQEYEKIQ